ncbi:MAG: DNA polymerase III subunit alpha [Simkaniaceae bacterium]|nr:DNA polymerase III subunit alpha [Simkaniaceae bacterium]
MSYIPLSVHSQYSILNSTASVQGLAEAAQAAGMEALALTDSCNMYGAVDFFKACQKVGVKPIIGIEIMVAPGALDEKKRIIGKKAGYPIILFAMNEVGYRNLCVLSSKAFIEGFYYTPRIDKTILKEHSEGLICLSGTQNGPVADGIFQGDLSELEWYADVFSGAFYLQIERMQMASMEDFRAESWLQSYYNETIDRQEVINRELVKLSKERGIPLVATSTVCYLKRDDWRSHEILMNVQSGEPCEIIERDPLGNIKGRAPNPKRTVLPTHENFFKTGAEMEALFADLPEAIATSAEIAKRCEFAFDFDAQYYPVYTPPHLEGKGLTTDQRVIEAENFLRKLCDDGIVTRYNEIALGKVKEIYPDRDPMEVVRSRLDYELEIITTKGMCDYLLIVYDFIDWAKKSGIPVGPGRGSGAGSIILYLIGITDIEPLRFSLFFERFINPERLSYPDIDVDICMHRRVEVIEYTLQKYGHDKVAQIITFGTMKAKMAIKDVGRVLNIPLAKVNEIAKLVPDDLNMTLERALEIDPELKALYQADEDAHRVIDFAKQLEGSIRNTGIHAAGLIISGDKLTDHIPVCAAKDSQIYATQYAMKPVESVGMLKIDFLGLKTLTSIQKSVDMIRKTCSKEIDWVNLPLDNAKTFDLLNQGKTQGVFQLESTGMQELAKQLHIDKFEEIIAVGALYRPGPMEMIPSFINRKHGKEEIEIDHPKLAKILAETYGIMVYQEQVMQMAQELAGYSLGQGDVLRKAMGKKDADVMEKQKEQFKQGAIANGLSEKLAIHIFEKVEKFASYGFNKSHATAYGYLSYVTAFLKANYTGEWLSALMTCDMDDLTKVAKHIREAQSMEIDILPPDVNEAGAEFVYTQRGIRFAMTGIKGVGKGVVEAIVDEREKGGAFKTLYDFFERVDGKRVGKKVVENLINAGCFDFTEWTRQEMALSVEPMYDSAAQVHKEKERGVLDLFAASNVSTNKRFETPPPVGEVTSQDAILAKEKELLGFYLTGHPMELYRREIEELGSYTFDELRKKPAGTPLRLAFIVEDIKTRISKSQRKFAILTISDGHEQIELPVWPDLYESNVSLLRENRLLYGVVITENTGDELKLRCRWLADLSEMDDEAKALANEAVDRAKAMIKKEKSGQKNNQELTPQKKREVAEKQLKVMMELDASQMQLSSILQLKKIFLDRAGHIALDISVKNGGDKIGQLAIGTEWGVRFDGDLEMTLKRLPYVQKVELVSL